jgi:hypothetical protein
MNIFFTDENPIIAAQNQCDRHIVKMVVEMAQMLSTAHRIIDGKSEVIIKNNRKKKVWTHSNPEFDKVLYGATHYNHPSSVWVRASHQNYYWAYEHFIAMCEEYTFRYGKIHKCEKILKHFLKDSPSGIHNVVIMAFVKCMGASPESLLIDNPVEAYRHFYQTKQASFKMVWTKRPAPSWFKFIS